MEKGLRGEFSEQGVHPLIGLIGLTGGEKKSELIAPESGDEIGFAQTPLDSLGKLAKKGITGGMTGGVVDPLEPIDVQ
mgnify:CR=1 FL=1